MSSYLSDMEQLSILDLLEQDNPLPTNIKLLSLFSGIGAFEKALDRLGINYELVNYCEIDKYASRSYAAIHGVSEDKNLWDVTKVDEKALPKDIDLITYGFPCQDISLAGKQKGLFNEDGTKTRSGLFFDALRIIEETKPRVAIAENVKNLTGKKFNAQFQVVLASLEAAGYNNYWQVLNAKDYGVPQNRERVFIVSIRKGIDKGYTFPKGFPLEKRLKDVLEDTVDEKYYLDGKFENITKINENYSVMNGGIIGKMHDISRRAYSEQATAPTIPTCAGDNIQPKVIVEPMAYDEQNQYVRNDGCVGTLTTDGSSPKHNNRVLVWDGYNQRIRADQSCVGTSTQNCGADLKRNGQGIIELVERTLLKFLGRNQKNVEGDYAFCVDTAQTGGVKENMSGGTVRIRKLTPLETWRLMGFDDSDFHKAELVNSNTQLYKQAGNSIVVDVLERILKQIFNAI